MIQGTTPTYTFNLPIETGKISRVRVIFAQDDTEILRKEIGDCELVDKTIKTELTQEETQLFESGKRVQIQLRVKLNDGTVMASRIYTVHCLDALDEEVLV